MPFEDSSGCIWTQHEDDDGAVYYFNENTMASKIFDSNDGWDFNPLNHSNLPFLFEVECTVPRRAEESTWHLPESAREVGTAANHSDPTTALVPAQDVSSSWTRVVDDSTNTTYFFNTSTQESSWDLRSEQRLESGIYPVEEESLQLHNGSQEVNDGPTRASEVLKDFQIPEQISEAVGKAGSSRVWPLQVADDQPSRLQRWNVLKAEDPYREHFAPGDAWREHPEFEPKLCFYAFDAVVEHVERYWVEEAEAPFRCRLQRRGLKFSRDIARWETRVDITTPSTHDPSGRPNPNEEGGGNELEGMGGEKGGAGFFAFPLRVHSSHAHHVDWASGPDRYQITRGTEPEWGWTRLFTFFAYAASKYHVMETTESPLAQKIVKGHFLEPESGWKCVLAFFAFDNELPGSNRYYVENKTEPHYRTRVGMEPSCRWEPRYSFAAFDVPVPGACALDVHYTIRSADSLNAYPDQCRISVKDPWGPWEQKFRFYAFPASYVQLSEVKKTYDDGGEQDWSAFTRGAVPVSDVG